MVNLERKEKLEEKVKSMENEKKGIKLNLEEGRIAFLDVELKSGRKNEKIRTK